LRKNLRDDLGGLPKASTQAGAEDQTPLF